jgi:class 3 adenylate cyclase/tetratricopeptide (TPR) repeat protein
MVAMQAIADWLEKLGMSEYAQRFVENGIDFSVLLHLTDQDLKDIGVLLGHRRKMLAAITAMTGTEPKPQDTAERRQVTVMFSDLVGSTALSARMDPEDMREIISAYQKCVAGTVQRFGGFVAKYMGDGVLIYFGYPQAHEDDAERAVRAGLELIQAVGGLKSSAPLQTRVGIATGLVVVGDLIGSGAAQEQAIVGETPNLAARLQGLAEPNSVVIAGSTRKLLGNLFELEDLGAKDLKGMGGPVRAWAALRPATVESRFEALHASGLTELVGREEELEILLRRWSKAKTGEGQVVLLSGEAGIGKSRLTAALLERLAAEPHTRLRYFCSPQHTDSAFYPIIGQMERAAGFVHDDTPQAKLDKLDALLAQTSTSKQDATLFAEMLSLPNDGRYPALDLEPQQRRQKTLEALTAQVEALSRQNPVLMIFEDAHWTDPTSLETLGRIVDRVRSLPVLLIVTFRPEFDPAWIGRPYVTALTINRLAQRDIEAMIDGVIGNKFIPASVRHDIVERTDGIPLFVEEMTKAVLEAGNEGAALRTVAAIPSTVMAAPASLQASLMARLDRLGSAREVAQIGAAIGREFSHDLLAAVAGKTDAVLGSALDRLIAAGLLFRQGVPPHASYLFKHALVQDAAYGTLLRERRRALHAGIAETLESQFADIAENQPELLARHCTEGGLIEKGVGYWLHAGRQSWARSAMSEAEAQIKKGLGLLPLLPDDDERDCRELDLQMALGATLSATAGYAARGVGQAYARARQLCERLDRPLELAFLLNGQCVYHVLAGNLSLACKEAQDILDLAAIKKNEDVKFVGIWGSAIALFHMGDFTSSKIHAEQALKLHRRENPLFPWMPNDPKASALNFLFRSLSYLGYLDHARFHQEKALAYARERHPYALAEAVQMSAEIDEALKIDARVRLNRAEESIAHCAEQCFPFWATVALRSRGESLLDLGRANEAVIALSDALIKFQAIRAFTNVPVFRCSLAKALGKAGQPGEGLKQLAEAERQIESTQARWYEAEMHRVYGELQLAVGDPVSAEGRLDRAITVARRQNAKLWEIRAATSLARLWRDQGKRTEARDLLAPLYGWFTGGLDTPILQEAKTLLDQLGGGEPVLVGQ